MANPLCCHLPYRESQLAHWSGIWMSERPIKRNPSTKSFTSGYVNLPCLINGHNVSFLNLPFLINGHNVSFLCPTESLEEVVTCQEKFIVLTIEFYSIVTILPLGIVVTCFLPAPLKGTDCTFFLLLLL